MFNSSCLALVLLIGACTDLVFDELSPARDDELGDVLRVLAKSESVQARLIAAARLEIRASRASTPDPHLEILHQGLRQSLGDESEEVQYGAAIAIAALCRQNPTLRGADRLATEIIVDHTLRRIGSFQLSSVEPRWALGLLGNSSPNVEQIFNDLASSELGSNRQLAVQVAAMFEQSWALALLRKAATDPDEDVRFQATEELAKR